MAYRSAQDSLAASRGAQDSFIDLALGVKTGKPADLVVLDQNLNINGLQRPTGVQVSWGRERRGCGRKRRLVGWDEVADGDFGMAIVTVAIVIMPWSSRREAMSRWHQCCMHTQVAEVLNARGFRGVIAIHSGLSEHELREVHIPPCSDKRGIGRAFEHELHGCSSSTSLAD